MEHNQTTKDHLAHTQYNQIEKTGSITRFLWQCAGADRQDASMP